MARNLRFTDEAALRAHLATMGTLPRTPPARPKYGNRKVTDAEGNVHDSTKEFKRWQELQLRERAGEIRSLRRQVPFALVVGGVLVCTYVADFVYDEGEAKDIVEDTKPTGDPKYRKTEAYRMFRLKAKLMLGCHQIQIREV